LFSFY